MRPIIRVADIQQRIYYYYYYYYYYSEIIRTYGAETWKYNKNLESNVYVDGYLRRSARCSRLEKIRNTILDKKNEY